MKKAIKVENITWFLAVDEKNAKSLLPHKPAKQPNSAVLLTFRHKTDTFLNSQIKMRAPSEPKINTNNDREWFIYWNHDVPPPLWHLYQRKRIRIRVNDDINRLRGAEREAFAEERRLVWKYKLERLNYNPFEEELAELSRIKQNTREVTEQIQAIETAKAVVKEMPEEDKRKLFTIPQAFEKFMQSRRDRKLEPETLSSYQGLVDWVTEGLAACEYDKLLISELRHIHLSDALTYIAEEREWVATTINKGVEFMMTLFNFLETEEYIFKNPSKGKFIKLPTYKTKHRWFDRATKKLVIDEIKRVKNIPLLRACQFTYWLMIRSKKELRMLKVGDIDRDLKRVRFTAELSKNKNETYRDYPAEFGEILNEMDLKRYPGHFYVFGSKDGTPGPVMCGHNYFSKMFKVIKDQLGLSMDYTVYGFKHTRIVHELMKGVDGYEISYMARHNDRQSTKEYQRDYDITLNNVYSPEDLAF